MYSASFSSRLRIHLPWLDVLQILNDMTGNLDAKKACTGALKLHKKYMKKVRYFLLYWLSFK